MPTIPSEDPASGPSAIVIGGSGWSGGAICDSLRNAKIQPLTVGRADAPLLPLEQLCRRLGLAGNPSSILAVVNVLRPSSQTEAEAYVQLSGQMAEACRKIGVKYIHIGSAAEYGSHAEGLIDEDSPKKPTSTYGKYKLSASQAALKHQGIVVRPFNLVGPQQPMHTAVGEWVHQMRDSKLPEPSITITNGSTVRDFIPVQILGEIVAWIAQNSLPWNSLNACSGIGTSFSSYCNALLREAITRRLIPIESYIVDLRQGPNTSIVGLPRRLKEIGIPVTTDLVHLVQLSFREVNEDSTKSLNDKGFTQ